MQSRMKLVSVVIPTRNRASLLRQTLRSVLDQTWPEIEIIVVDEASEDDTDQVLAEFTDELRVIRHQVPKGLPAVRNIGSSEAKGNYILHLDDDDLIHPSHIEELVQFSEELSSDSIASSGWRRFQIRGDRVELESVVRPPAPWEAPEAISAIFGHEPGCLIWGPSVLWPSHLLDEMGWDEELPHNQEVDFFGRVLLAGYKFVGTEAGMAYYRVHGGVRQSDSHSEADLIASARCRLRHARLLQQQPFSDAVAPAMREALMRVLIGLSAHGGLQEWKKRVKHAYSEWGGTSYYLPQPPESRVKHLFLQTVLRLGGPEAVGGILRAKKRLSRKRGSDTRQIRTLEYDKMIRQIMNIQ
jgi:GT2 family glycosyltransferase